MLPWYLSENYLVHLKVRSHWVFLMLCFMHQQCKRLAVAKANNICCACGECVFVCVCCSDSDKRKMTRNCSCFCCCLPVPLPSLLVSLHSWRRVQQLRRIFHSNWFPTWADTSLPELAPVRMNQHKLMSHHWLCTKSQVEKVEHHSLSDSCLSCVGVITTIHQ